MENANESFETEFKVDEIVWGHTKMDILNGYDNIGYSTLKLKNVNHTLMLFKNHFKFFQNVYVGYCFKAEIKLWKNNTYNLIRIIPDHPKLALAKDELKNSNFAKSKILFEDYFKNCNFLEDAQLPLGIYSDSSMYIENLIQYFKFDISKSNPYYVKYEQTLEKCYTLIDEKTYDLKEGVTLISWRYHHSKLNFGKYKGQIIFKILKEDPEYLFSLIVDTDHFCLTPLCFLFNDYSKVSNFKIALEINLIKMLLQDEYNKSMEHAYDDYLPFKDYGGFDSWEELSLGQAFEGDVDAWNSHYD